MKIANCNFQKCLKKTYDIGFDDVDLCEFTTPALTTVHAPAYDMGQYGVNFLFASSNLTLSTPIKVKMSCEIIERESCGTINSNG